MEIAFPLLDSYLFIFNICFCDAEDATCPLMQSSLSSFTAFFPTAITPKPDSLARLLPH